MSPSLGDLTGRRVLLKLESLNLTHSFKIRGAFNALLELIDAHPEPASRPLVVTASAGNHGRAMAYAAERLGLALVVFAPTTAPQSEDRRHSPPWRYPASGAGLRRRGTAGARVRGPGGRRLHLSLQPPRRHRRRRHHRPGDRGALSGRRDRGGAAWRRRTGQWHRPGAARRGAAGPARRRGSRRLDAVHHQPGARRHHHHRRGTDARGRTGRQPRARFDDVPAGATGGGRGGDRQRAGADWRHAADGRRRTSDRGRFERRRGGGRRGRADRRCAQAPW